MPTLRPSSEPRAQAVTVTTPDPSVLTSQSIERAVTAERDYVDGQLAVRDERLRGIDIATKLLSDTVGRVPTDVQKEVMHLRELVEEKFGSITTQFKERDTRSERESRDGKTALDAALSAQKDAASEQNKSNTLAITKSEASTTETINKLSELFKSTTDALSDQISDLKDRLTRSETALATKADNQTERRGTSASAVAIIGLVAGSLIGLAGLLMALFRH